MKRTLAISLLCVFAFQWAGVFLLFKSKQQQIRQAVKLRIKQGVPENELSNIIVGPENKNKQVWQNEKEFRYDGIMYDVVAKTIIDENTILYRCVTDRQETELFADLDEQIKKEMQGDKDGKKPLKKLLELLSQSYTQAQKQVFVFLYVDAVSADGLFCRYSARYSPPAIQGASPPPKTV